MRCTRYSSRTARPDVTAADTNRKQSREEGRAPHAKSAGWMSARSWLASPHSLNSFHSSKVGTTQKGLFGRQKIALPESPQASLTVPQRKMCSEGIQELVRRAPTHRLLRGLNPARLQDV